MHTKLTVVLSLLLLSGVGVLAQGQPALNENGTVQFYGDAGWSFGLPAVRAVAFVKGLGPAISPEKKTLAAPSFGMTVTAWKFLVPFADFTVYDTGKATASVGPLTSVAQADTWSFNGGLRLVGGKSRLRGYAELGGGVLYQNLKATFTVAGQSASSSASGSSGSFMYGGGMQLFGGRRWGSDIGFDGFHTDMITRSNA